MKEYILEVDINGTEKRLSVLHPSEGIYRVYWDALYLGNVEPVIDDNLGLRWVTNYEDLKYCVQEIGAYIEDCDS